MKVSDLRQFPDDFEIVLHAGKVDGEDWFAPLGLDGLLCVYGAAFGSYDWNGGEANAVVLVQTDASGKLNVESLHNVE